MTRRGIAWSITAVLGIICAAAVAWTAGQLAGQHIGLSSEPLAVAQGLAPTDKESSTAQRREEHRVAGNRRPTRPGKNVQRTKPAATGAGAGNQSSVLPATTPPATSASPTPPSSASPYAATARRTTSSSSPSTAGSLGSSQKPNDSTGQGSSQHDDNGGPSGGSGGRPDD